MYNCILGYGYRYPSTRYRGMHTYQVHIIVEFWAVCIHYLYLKYYFSLDYHYNCTGKPAACARLLTQITIVLLYRYCIHVTVPTAVSGTIVPRHLCTLYR